MAKNYTVRAEQRISARLPFLYHGEDFHGKGHLWDLSTSGWRATGDHPVTQGMVMPVYLYRTAPRWGRVQVPLDRIRHRSLVF